MNKIFSIALVSGLMLAGILGCNQPKQTEIKTDTGWSGYNIIATTGQINSALVKLTEGTSTKITLFCGPGVDPHSYSATTKDVEAMVDAHLIVYNGFHLEAKLSEQLDSTFKDKAWSMASAFPTKDRLEWEEEDAPAEEESFDPHIWNHLPAWSECVQGLADKLVELDRDNGDVYRKNAEAYIKEINEAHEWAKEKLSALPEDRRVLVSAHDAFNYFAKVYGLETFAVLGIGNDPEADYQTMKEVAEKVTEKKVPAVFMENITNPKVISALQEACAAKDWKVEVVPETLYSDDIGETAPQNTFLGAFRSNVEIIVKALSPKEVATTEAN
ncbi:MAG: zinc ABC transporter substrate-binding protein [Planctomycetota bacterium]